MIHKILEKELRYEVGTFQVYVPHKNPRQAKEADMTFVARCPNVFTIGKIAAVDTDSARYRKALVWPRVSSLHVWNLGLTWLQRHFQHFGTVECRQHKPHMASKQYRPKRCEWGGLQRGIQNTHCNSGEEETDEVESQSTSSRDVSSYYCRENHCNGKERAEQGSTESILRVPESSLSLGTDNNNIWNPSRQWCTN